MIGFEIPDPHASSYTNVLTIRKGGVLCGPGITLSYTHLTACNI